MRRFVRYGASPRGLQAMIIGAKSIALLDNRHSIDHNDLQATIYPALRHRLILNYEGQAEGISADEILTEVLKSVKRKM